MDGCVDDARLCRIGCAIFLSQFERLSLALLLDEHACDTLWARLIQEHRQLELHPETRNRRGTEFGLRGKVGFAQPMAAAARDAPQNSLRRGMGVGINMPVQRLA